jgi:hypothetical protein
VSLGLEGGAASQDMAAHTTELRQYGCLFVFFETYVVLGMYVQAMLE